MKVLLPIETGLGNAVLITSVVRSLKKFDASVEVHLVGGVKSGAMEVFRDDPQIASLNEDLIDGKYDVLLLPFFGDMKHLYIKVKRLNPTARLLIHDDTDGLGSRSKKHLLSKLGAQYVPINQNRHEVFNNFDLLRPLGLSFETHFVQPSLSPELIQACSAAALSRFNDSVCTVVQLGAANSVDDPKCWDLARWEQLVRNLLDEGEKLRLVGGPSEADLGRQIASRIDSPDIEDLTGKTTIHELIGLLVLSKIMIGVDSGIAHMSAVLSRPTVVLWGPSSFQKSHPIGPSVYYVNKHKPCAPCYGPAFYGLLSPREAVGACESGGACMEEIHVEDVLEQIQLARKADK